MARDFSDAKEQGELPPHFSFRLVGSSRLGRNKME
jgi:hypothetical protein